MPLNKQRTTVSAILSKWQINCKVEVTRACASMCSDAGWYVGGAALFSAHVCDLNTRFSHHVVCAASTSSSVQIPWRVIAGKSWITYRDHTDPRINLNARFHRVSAAAPSDFRLNVTHIRLYISCAFDCAMWYYDCLSLSHNPSVCV